MDIVQETSFRFDLISAELMELPIYQIHQPQEAQLIDKADTTFVRNLKLNMVGDPTAPGATPIAVFCTADCILQTKSLKTCTTMK